MSNCNNNTYLGVWSDPNNFHNSYIDIGSHDSAYLYSQWNNDISAGEWWIEGPTHLTQPIIDTQYTPTDFEDTTGLTGQITFDNSYIYIKTNAGWARAALTLMD